jgi:Family of unknown function (DUF6221)
VTNDSVQLVAFLLARVDEDERAARAAPPGPWLGTDAEDVGAWSVYDPEWRIAVAKVYDHDQPLGGKRGPGYIDPEAVTAHIARHNPARVMAEVEAKRQQIDHYERVAAHAAQRLEYNLAEETCYVALRCVALAYADHPDYDETWRP